MLKSFGPVRSRWLRRIAHGLARWSARLGVLSIRYPSLTLQHRLVQFRSLSLPFEAGTFIRFNDHFVPYVHANTPDQLAFALGAITEFQRGPQLQFLKRLAQGRLSEMGGRQFIDMDHLIRLLDFGRAGPEIWANMPADSRSWVEHFVSGLNCVQAQRGRGLDERLMGIRPEPYTPLDILRFGRLAGADVNWPIYFSLIEHRLSGDFIAWWNRLKRVGAGVSVSFQAPGSKPASVAQQTAALLAGIARSGSNSMVLHGTRTHSGHPLMVNDPHLGQHLPNVWMMVGLHSPGIQAVGLMFPGVPVLGLGRNPALAWGGTNLRAASSDLVRLDPATLANATTQVVHIKTRLGWGRKRTLRNTPHGPVLTDCAALGRLCGNDPLALRWAGHWPTDEISCFLKAMQANSVPELHQAMAGVGVTPLNVLGADVHGNIGHVLAATLPKRNGFPDDDWVLPEDLAHQSWSSRMCASDFPSVINPPEGFLVSANNRPSEVDGLGFLFNGDDRVMRARHLLAGQAKLSAQALLDVQLDVCSPLAQRLSSDLAAFSRPHASHPAHKALCNTLEHWDGSYSADSLAAVQFECYLHALVRGLSVLRHGGRIPALMEQWSYLSSCLLEDLIALNVNEREALVPKALQAALDSAQPWPMWGTVHKIRLRHVLGHVPLLGKWFSSKSFPGAGSRETLMKNAHGFIRGFDETSYGSQSRHLSDLDDLDENHFVLLGGQDGWVGSTLMTDQIDLWQTRQSIQMPLRTTRIQELFPHWVGKLE
ncbi:penicillin acylase family protein [Limnobacter sp.]|uniref:penicillin acylase family protein n=1 Tax=Limnobacter sp. TaxID=2003368 RepID=UPI0035157153